uniref:Putative secreted protein n=1 Tax=Anopheles darlingi TaxID=43151 RepID=A0A2M4D6S2_ANODA
MRAQVLVLLPANWPDWTNATQPYIPVAQNVKAFNGTVPGTCLHLKTCRCPRTSSRVLVATRWLGVAMECSSWTPSRPLQWREEG